MLFTLCVIAFSGYYVAFADKGSVQQLNFVLIEQKVGTLKSAWVSEAHDRPTGEWVSERASELRAGKIFTKTEGERMIRADLRQTDGAGGYG